MSLMPTWRYLQQIFTVCSRAMLSDWHLAGILERAFRNDEYYSHYFRGSAAGQICRRLLFFDEIEARRRRGQVFEESGGVALVGYPPYAVLGAEDLSVLTRLCIALQGPQYRKRWTAAWDASQAAPTQTMAYLSAIACPDHNRRRGIGTRLLQRAVIAAAERGLPLSCEVSNRRLVNWYQRRGFEVIGEKRITSTFTVYYLVSVHGSNPVSIVPQLGE